jgi:acyl transferase domain-containing protein/NADPH:quinone reductase-like Zn-dependent oxidoreductase/acyl carrier protein
MRGEEIAIVGASCRFPGGDGIEAFWRLLAGRGDAIAEVHDTRWSTRFYFHPNRSEPGKSYTWAAALIDGVDLFDPAVFGISPREAKEMDPQQRILLELVWHALEDAGIPAAQLADSPVGVYIGASAHDYSDLRIGDPASGDAWFMTGNAMSVLANRISHVFDLRGPSLVLDTACSSSLVALHHACEAIRDGRIPAAIVGGINLLLAPYPFLGFSRAGMLSRLGRCYAFDARADGYVRGEGGAVVVLKPLARALADHDPIRALIRNTGVNSDGRTTGLSLPSEEAQRRLLREVYEGAGVTADELAFFEMHGTGTPAGDPVEADAVGGALGRNRCETLPIGSVKTNIGHLEPASGMAGLLKAALALERGLLPPTLNCESPNPKIDFKGLNLRLVRELEPIAHRRKKRYAGVNSFGFGGTNAHAVLAAPPWRRHAAPAAAGMPPLVLSARSEASLKGLAGRWRDALAGMDAKRAASAARAAARRRDHHTHRLVARAADAAGARRALGDFLDGAATADVVTGTALRKGGLAFVFSGNGAQFPGMAADVWRSSGTFRAAVEEVDDLLRPELGWSLAKCLADGVDRQALARADVAQPLLFATQTGIVRALAACGLAAEAHLGHSVGEIAAAWATGALSLDAAARVVLVRSRAQQRTAGQGRMAALGLGEEQARALFEEIGSPLEIAAINAGRSLTVSGTVKEIARLSEAARRRGIACRPLDFDFAFHSRAMDGVRDDIIAGLAGLSAATPRARLVSSVTGSAVAGDPLDAEHWWRNIRYPVRFAEAVAQLIAEGHRIFLEIGPSGILQSYLHDGLRQAEVDGRVIASLSREERGGEPFAQIAARCHVAGCDLSRAPIFEGSADPRGLPLYPFDRARFWFDETSEAVRPASPSCQHPLLGFRRDDAAPLWLNHLDTQLLPWLADHRVDGTPVLPASAFVEIAFAAARACWPQAAAMEIADLELRRPLGIEKERLRELRTTLDADSGRWQLMSRPRLSDEAVTVHAVATLSAAADARQRLDWPAARPQRRLDAAQLYRIAEEAGLDYGPGFRTVECVEITEPDGATVYLDAAAIGDCRDPYLLHPALSDGALHSLLALLDDRGEEHEGVAFLPWRFGRITLLAPFGRHPRVARGRVTRRGIRSARADLVLLDEAGELVAELADCWFRRVELARPGIVEARMLRVDLVPAPLEEPMERVDGMAETPRLVAADYAADPAQAEQRLLFEAAVRQACDAERDDTLPEYPEIWRTLLAGAPVLAGDLALVAAVAAGDHRTDFAAVERLTHASPASAAGIEYLRAALEHIAGLWPKHRKLRVLEMAPGGGVATRRLSECLARSGIEFTYLVTDPEDAFRSESRADIILAVNALARLRLDVPAVTRLRNVMAPGGLFLAVEPEPNPLWGLLFGDLPLRGGNEWSDLFEKAGFLSAETALVAEAPWRCAALWASTPSLLHERPVIAPQPRTIAIFGGGRFAASLCGHLTQAGHRASLARLLDAEIRKDATLLFLAQRSGRADPAVSAARQVAALSRLAKRAAEAGASLWVVTCDAQQATALERSAGLVGAALWGMARTLKNELPRLDLRLVDVAADLHPAERAWRIAAELSAESVENEIVLGAEGRRVPRLRRGLPPRWAKPEDGLALSKQTAPGLDRLSWEKAGAGEPGRGEVAIEVHAAGLNFRDAMWAAGLLPEEALIDGFAGAGIGLECAGIILASGPGVEGLRAGDRVMALAPAALASCAVTNAAAAAQIPQEISFAAAATVPVAFMTAFYALGTLGRLMPRECVLIHAAAGGVGLAAIQYAKGRGATVIATAGSATKRAFLSLVGADHALDSRDPGFAEAVRELTAGEGVDVVLNSLVGAAMEKSLGLVKPFGRFLELGKRDFYQGGRIPLRPLRHNAQYFAVDIDQLPLRRPELARSLFAEVSAALSAGAIRQLAHRIFPFAELDDALRLMQASDHIGKIVLVPDSGRGVRLGPSSAFAARSDGTYLVTGGIDGFGFEAARWLVARGAKRVALLSRRGAEAPGAAARIAELAAAGADIGLLAADVGDRASLSAALDRARAMGRPLVGILHAAAEISDGLASDIEPSRVEAVLRTKLTGALLLDELTRSDPIETFLLYSSATTLVGAPGQGAYVAANLALEALARWRHTTGRPATAVAWGPIADTGHLATRPKLREALARRLGATPLPARGALSGLSAMLDSALPVIAHVEANWSGAQARLPILAAPLYSELRAAGGHRVAEKPLAARLAALGPQSRRELLQSVVAEEAAAILRLPAGAIDLRRPLSEIGMDSLMAVELRLALERRLGIDLPLLLLAEGMSIAALAERLAAAAIHDAQAGEVVALAARHAAVDLEDAWETSEMAEPKPRAAK